MKKDSFVLNFILGVILMILLAFAAKAQDKNSNSKSITTPAVKKKKQLSADEAKVLYEEKYSKQDSDKRKSYSRKDIEENIPEASGETKASAKPNEKIITETKENAQITNQPKAIYKGPSNKVVEKEPNLKPIEAKPKALVFLEHIEVDISNQ